MFLREVFRDDENESYKQGVRGLARIFGGGKVSNRNPINDDPVWDVKVNVDATTTDGYFVRKIRVSARDSNVPLQPRDVQELLGQGPGYHMEYQPFGFQQPPLVYDYQQYPIGYPPAGQPHQEPLYGRPGPRSGFFSNGQSHSRPSRTQSRFARFWDVILPDRFRRR